MYIHTSPDRQKDLHHELTRTRYQIPDYPFRMEVNFTNHSSFRRRSIYQLNSLLYVNAVAAAATSLILIVGLIIGFLVVLINYIII